MSALLALLRRIPLMAWVTAFVVASLVAAGIALYRSGVTAGEVHVHREALSDSVHVAEERKDTAAAHSATVVAVADKARHVSEATRADRVAVRRAALAQLIDPGLTHVHDLVALDDSLSARDSVTIAVQAGAIDTLTAEITARAQLDTLRVHQLELGAAEPDHHTTAKIVGGAVAGAALVLTAFRFLR